MTAHDDAVEAAALGAAGVRILYPASPLHTAPAVAVDPERTSCTLRIGTDVGTDARTTIAAVAEAVRVPLAQHGADPILVVEIATIE